MNKTIFSKTLLATGLVACTSLAQAEFSANVALTSDYVFRGFSQSKEDPAIQGGFDYAHKSGFYAGVWGSNVSSDMYNGSGLEADLYAGYSGEITKDLGYDVGLIRYIYPGSSPSTDYDEIYAGLSYKFISVKYFAGVDIGNAELGDYLDAGLDFDLPQGIGLGLHVGNWNSKVTGGDFTDYKIGLSKEIGGFGFELAYTDTDVDSDALASGRVVLTVSKSL
ncbi:MAG: hypothetical protein GXP09_12700 [Gammaproteobacteria bacterium]|nr:hypothetical protein [Gammaproteobacteria bacterium]